MDNKSAEVTKEWMDNFLKNNPRSISELIANNLDTEQLYKFQPEMARSPSKTKSMKSVQQNASTSSVTSKGGGGVFAAHRTISNLTDFIEETERRPPPIARKATLNVQTIDYARQDELFLELVIDITHELSVDTLCHKILANVATLTNSDRASMFLARVDHKGAPYLESKLFNVDDLAGRVATPNQAGGELYRIPFGKGICGMVAQTKKVINVADAYQDERFNREIDLKTGYRTKSLLTMPILNYENAVIGVAQIMNKQGASQVFTKEDEEVFSRFLVFCGISLTNAELFGISVSEFKINQLLLVLARDIFAEQTNLDNLAKMIMLDIQSLISCDRCILYLLNRSSKKDIEITKAFDMDVSDKTIMNPTEEVFRQFPATNRALEAARSGEPNEFDANESNSEETEPIVSSDGYVITNLLSMPVFDTNKKIVGVVQMINKTNNLSFNETDKKTVTTFSLFCGLGICNCRAYENKAKMLARQKVNLDVLSYYAAASDGETETLAKAKLMNIEKLRLSSFDFNDASLNDFETCKTIITIFSELQFISKFKIHEEVLCRWVLTVKKNYRPAVYHNWRHSVNVTQMMFFVFNIGHLSSILSDFEMFTLIIAAVCHDLDHRTEAASINPCTREPLAFLYSTSSVEHHYIDQCLMLLNNEKMNIFSNLSHDDYKLVLVMLEYCILSTDLNIFYKRLDEFQTLVLSNNAIDWKNEDSRCLLRAMLMVTADVCCACKPWSIHVKTVHLVFAEFIELNKEPQKSGSKILKQSSINKRIKYELPKLQIGFMESVCDPLYKLMCNVFPTLQPLYNASLENLSRWRKLDIADDDLEKKATCSILP